jgi:phage baseplate assembly protein W
MALDVTKHNWAYDLSKNALSKAEILDVEVINQSIEMILATNFGERVFNPYFGSTFTLNIFDGFSQQKGESIINDLVTSIKKWENRITIDESNIKLKFTSETGVLEIYIPYVINRERIKSFFLKKIVV